MDIHAFCVSTPLLGVSTPPLNPRFLCERSNPSPGVEAVGEQRVPHAGGARVESGQVTADGVHDEIFKHNSRVYAARTDGGMGGFSRWWT